MPTAQTGSTETSSAARAGCMHSGAMTVAPSAAAPPIANCRPVLAAGSVAASEASGQDGAGDGGVRGEPAHPDELGRPLVDGRTGERAGQADDAETVRDAELAGPGQHAHPERREQQSAPGPKGHVGHVTHLVHPIATGAPRGARARRIGGST